MRKILTNAFSLQMLAVCTCKLKVEEIERPSDLSIFESAIGHQDLANILNVTMNRVSVTLNPNDELIVCQVVGGRLPKGTKVLPEGVTFKWIKVMIDSK